jgi:type I restriction enzyme, S subunit
VLGEWQELERENNWKVSTIRSVADGIYDGPHATPKKTETGPVFLGISCLNRGRLDLASVEHLSENDFQKWTRRVTPQEDDIVFSYETRIGEVAIVPRGLKCCLGRRMALVRINQEKMAPRFFLYYYLSPAFQEFLISRTIPGSTVDRILLTEFPKFPIAVPPLAEQKAIARILGALDDKIELNRRMNRTLEAMAQALFKSWFVDFEPVVAKREGRKPAGMDAATAALFPEHFQDSDLGTIPTGWETSTIGKIADVIDCLHSKKPDRMPSGKSLLQLNNIMDDGLLDLSDWYLISEDDYDNWISRMEAQQGDCVITNVGRVGAVSQIPPGVKAALGRNMTGIRCKRNFSYPTFLIECLLSETMKDEVAQKTDAGTILDALNVKNIPLLRFVTPTKPILRIFETRVRPIRERMERNLKASMVLATLRDALLPRLLSGEIRVGQAEKVAEEA